MAPENKGQVNSYSVSGEYLTKLITYLAQRPYYETNQLIDELKFIINEQNSARTKLEVVPENKTESGS